jgi:Na+-transporting NADH:ubiquinone oxidoreductase subunit NqrC|tara:strand:+ start:136 stop:588 length:453 start_codon:yes stop_codon:yes gene_type:complete
MKKIKLLGILLLLTPITSYASDLVHTFGSPSFSGIGQSQHFLSIAQIEHNRKQKLQDDKESAEREAAREEANKTINKFINNVESRIYAQISKNLVDSMFEDDGALSGTAELEGATIYWVKDLTAGTITVTITDEDGTVTELVVPLTGFGF